MIKEFEKKGRLLFLLKSEKISCLLRINNGQVEMVHFGAPISEHDAEAMTVRPGPGWGTSTMFEEVCFDTIPLAWSCGLGDYRELPMETNEAFRFKKFETGVFGMTLPHAEAEETLKIVLESDSLELELYFSVFDTAMTRHTVIRNKGQEDAHITKLMSSMTDIKGDFEMITLDGGWISEAHEHRTPVSYSKIVNESLTGFSSNRHNPGFVLADGDECYGFNLVYSGNHYASVQKSKQRIVRVIQGINHDSFDRVLRPGECFETPEAVISYSSEGLNGMRHNMHRFVNEHIVPEYWRYRERPVLYNNWEGTMFDFNESKLLSLARKARNAGCELFVLDDGWFGERNSDTAGLGDYNVNYNKLPNGLEGLGDRIRSMGMDFGLWFEPEGVNPDSDLYRAHPDWALDGLLGRNELLLDLRREDVRDYIVENVGGIIDRAGLKYVKWDMNRHSCLTGNDAHEYILGLYDVLGRIFKSRPEVLLENCASGGNRFDLGMLTFGPQAWASDNTDPIERLDIQNGLSYLYPQSTMGAHIAAGTSIQTLRSTPLSTRANVAFFGAFGIELELSHLLPAELGELKDAVSFYKKHRKTFQFGELSALKCEKNATAWQVSGRDETIIGLFHRLVNSAQGYEWLRAVNLEKNRVYSVTSRPQSLRVKQFSGMVKYIAPVDLDPNGTVIRLADKYYRMKDSVEEITCTGAALESGIPMNLKFTGTGYEKSFRNQGDFGSNIYILKRKS